jgi:hypothetical protein
MTDLMRVRSITKCANVQFVVLFESLQHSARMRSYFCRVGKSRVRHTVTIYVLRAQMCAMRTRTSKPSMLPLG